MRHHSRNPIPGDTRPSVVSAGPRGQARHASRVACSVPCVETRGPADPPLVRARRNGPLNHPTEQRSEEATEIRRGHRYFPPPSGVRRPPPTSSVRVLAPARPASTGAESAPDPSRPFEPPARPKATGGSSFFLPSSPRKRECQRTRSGLDHPKTPRKNRRISASSRARRGIMARRSLT